ncbi:hypothetical protein AAG906_018494 [Vitis piasezkii]
MVLYRKITTIILLLRVKAYIYCLRDTVPLINGEEIFYVVMMTLSGNRDIITLQAAVRNHSDRMWVMADTLFGMYLLLLSFLWLRLMVYLFLGFWLAWAFVLDESVRLLLDVGTLLILACVCNTICLKQRLFRLLWLTLVSEAAMPHEQGENKAILFTKEQFNAGLRFPLPALFKEFTHFTRFHPSLFTPTLSGA